MIRIAVLLAALALAAPAQAQYALRDLQALGLGNTEWKAMGAAAQTLYSPTVAAEGATAQWSTPNGSKGEVTLSDVQTRRDGSTCVVLSHRVTAAKATEAKSGRSRRCRQPSGVWQFSAE